MLQVLGSQKTMKKIFKVIIIMNLVSNDKILIGDKVK